MESSKPINNIIHQLIHNANSALEYLPKSIEELSAKKKNEYNKIIEHFFCELDLICLDFDKSYGIFLEIVRLAGLFNVYPKMQISILQGFIKYWNSRNYVKSRDKSKALDNYRHITNHLLKDYGQYFYEHYWIVQHEIEVLDEIRQLLETDYVRALKMILIFRFQTKIEEELILSTLITKQFQFFDIEFYFQNKPGLQKDLINQLFNKANQKQAVDRAVELIKKFKLDPKDFPQVVWFLSKKGLTYFFRNNPMFVVELKYALDPDYLAYYTTYLMKLGNQREAWSMLKKYKHILIENHVFKLQNKSDAVEKFLVYENDVVVLTNMLEEYDNFGATELRVLGEPIDYLQLSDFGIKQKDVHFIDNVNKQFEYAICTLMKEDYLGFDLQFSGGINTFDENRAEILQISGQKQIFVFDFNRLKQFAEFTSFINIIFVESKCKLIGHGLSQDLKIIQSEIKLSGKIKQIQDTQKIYRKERPKSQIGLADIVKQLFNKPLSKFQQMSCWYYRPLRKAQLHYAALDAFVLIKIYKRLKGLNS